MRGRILILALTPVLGTFALFSGADLRINTSASLPVGLYIVSSNGTFVEFCPDDHGLSAQRHYRARGACPDGAAPLLKPVIGSPADEVVVRPAGIAVNGKLLPHTAPVEFSFSGVSVAQGQTGFCHPVPGVSGLPAVRGRACPLNATSFALIRRTT